MCKSIQYDLTAYNRECKIKYLFFMNVTASLQDYNEVSQGIWYKGQFCIIQMEFLLLYFSCRVGW